MFIHEMKLTVRHSETGLYSMAQHYYYYIWMEMAQEDYLQSVGMPYRQLESKGCFFPQVQTSCKFRYPAYYDDELLVRMRISELGAVKATFEFEIVRISDNAVVATASSVHAFTGSDLKPMVLKKRMPDFYALLEHGYQQSIE